jgi:hypothetical protein
LKSKYDRLKDKYIGMKSEWGSERALLLAQIDDLERRLRAAGDGSSSTNYSDVSMPIEEKPSEGEPATSGTAVSSDDQIPVHGSLTRTSRLPAGAAARAALPDKGRRPARRSTRASVPYRTANGA